MKTKLLLSIIVIFSFTQLISKVNKEENDQIQYKSELNMPAVFGPDKSSFPEPFEFLDNPRFKPSVSTGYYFVDSYETQTPYGDSFWHPFPIIEDTNDHKNGNWIRILPGPRSLYFPNSDSAIKFWASNPNGHHYFRNPAYPETGSWFEYSTDSTDDAIAGPMPLNLTSQGFIFNGIRYDSFYVSTNGIIALTNRRYLYDANGNRTIGGHGDCYDRMSMDWFNPTGDRPKSGIGSATSLNDQVPDNFGYQYAVLHNNPKNNTAGIRTRGGHLNSIFDNSYRSAVIAPFFGDLQLSQYSKLKKKPDDFGKVFFKKFNQQDKLIIYFVNVSPIRTLIGNPGLTYESPIDSRPGETNHVSASAQVVLNRLDSSITIQYEIFTGFVPLGSYGTVAATHVFLYNTSCGVLGWGRHVNNYKAKNSASYQEYLQYTHYFSRYQIFPAVDFPASGMAVKFKQWKNTLRVLSISYRVRSTDINKNLDFTEIVPTSLVDNFELLAGEERIGAVQPVAIVQNLTNDITNVDMNSPGNPDISDYPGTGINYFKQDLSFKVRCRIYNQGYDKIVYNRLMPVDSMGISIPANYEVQSAYFGNPYSKVRHVTVAQSGEDFVTSEITSHSSINGIPPYGFAEVFFPPFEPNVMLQDKYKNYTQIGRMLVEIECEPTNPRTNEKFGDQWPADNKMSRSLHVMKRLNSFEEFAIDWYRIKNEINDMVPTPMPSPERWVNIGTKVVSGEEVTHHPTAPQYNANYYYYNYQIIPNGYFGYKNKNWFYTGIGQEKINSPTIHMNRKTLGNKEYVPIGQKGGDELRSFPIDLKGKVGVVLSLAIQRTTNPQTKVFNRGFSDGTIVGCEPRTILNNNPYQPFNTSKQSVSYEPDEIVVEFAKSSPDKINGITNIGLPLPYIPIEKRGSWRYHPRRKGALPITNMAAFTLYGGGGSLRGFLETDKDSALTTVTGLRPDIYDDGFDESFTKYFITIPDTFIKAPNEGARNFRFRIRVNAINNQTRLVPPSIPDDDDNFYVDNITLLYPTEQIDLEVTSIDINWPYNSVPISQMSKVPVKVKISNNTSVNAPGFYVKVKIYIGTKDNIQDKNSIYCKRVEIPFLSPGANIEVQMPDWDVTGAAIKSQSSNFHIQAIVRIPGGDLVLNNDTNYYNVYLRSGEFFSYDYPTGVNNSVSAANGGNGRGLSLEGYNYGGIGNSTGALIYQTDPYEFGANGGSVSGQIAMKFEIFQPDTIKGYQAFFAVRNSAPDYITFAVYNDLNDKPNGKPITSSILERVQRGKDDIRKNYFFDQYVTYLLKTPVILPRGRYWASVAQLGQTGFELGASDTRMGMRTLNVSITPPISLSKEVGTEGTSLMIHKELRKFENGRLINNNLFAYENTYKSGLWKQFMPNSGNPAFGHLHHFGGAPGDGSYTWTLTRGTWVPFIRPYFGIKYPRTDRIYDLCDELCPVELQMFSCKSRHEGIDLFWETASEINNYGFYIEKKQIEVPDWKQIGFVNGIGTSSKINRYSFIDKDVALNNTYQYRLLQVDLDGSADCGTYSDIITINHSGETGLVLEQNYPNPFNTSTLINFTIPERCFVRLDILDLMGNIVCKPVNSLLDGKSHEVYWDRTCNDGRKAPAGTYIYRLTAGDDVKIGKMTVVE